MVGGREVVECIVTVEGLLTLFRLQGGGDVSVTLSIFCDNSKSIGFRRFLTILTNMALIPTA